MMNTAFIDRLRDEYIRHHVTDQIREDLIQENNVEKRDVIGYHGREILELLQNADDAYQNSIDQGNRPDEELVVEISYKENCLSISNTGTFFDEDGIKSIVQGNNSPKKGKYIGSKGTGFRSLLNWASSIRIFSGEFAVSFSRVYAKKIFDEIKNEKQIAKQLQKEKNLYIPMLAVPENIPHDRPVNMTTIEVDVDPLKSHDEFSVKKQLETIDMRILLFLPNVSAIRISTDDKFVEYQRSKSDCLTDDSLLCSDVTLSKTVNGKIEYSEQFKLFSKTIPQAVKENENEEILKDVQISIAVPFNDVHPIDHLYSFFPLLDTDAPFNCVMHATYELGDHRNNLTPSKVNKVIVEYQLDFLFEVANYLSREDAVCAQKILFPKSCNSSFSNIFPVCFSKFSLEEHFVSGASKLKVFKTVNDELISIADGPKEISHYPSCFKGEPFKKLLLDSVNDNTLIHLLANKLYIDLKFTWDNLCVAINSISDKWSVEERVETFIWWNSYRDTNTLPKLLKRRGEFAESQWLKYKEECYFLEGDFDSLKLPDWVKITILADEDQRELVKQTESKLTGSFANEALRSSGIIREICRTRIFPCLDFKYRDKSYALPLVNSSVTDFKRAVEFVQWIWEYEIHPPKEVNDSSQKINYKFPSIDGEIVSQDRLYFGSSYGYQLSDNLFSSDYKALPGLDVFGVDTIESEQFQNHFKEFGIVNYPQIELLDITQPYPAYDELMKSKILAAGVFSQSSSTRIENSIYKLPYIKALPDLLQKLSMPQVLEWIIKDQKLKEYLSYGVYPSNDKAYVKYRGNNQKYDTRWYYNGPIDNYILFTFQYTPWIEVCGVKKSPMEVLDAYTVKMNDRYKNFLAVLTVNDIENVAEKLKVTFEEVTNVLSYFTFPKDVTELSSDLFYGLMLSLPETNDLNDDNLSLSRAIYRIIEKPDFNKDFDNTANKKRFFEEGKLLVKYNGKLQYWPANESILPSTKIFNKNIYPIVDKGIRTNNKNFVRIFGCKEYNSDYEIVPNTAEISHENFEFQKYFIDFIKYAKAFSEKNSNIASVIHKLKVTLVKSISIKVNGEEITIYTDYNLLKRTDSDWYIVINQPSYDRNMMSECIENIFANIANTSGFDVSKIGELFRTNDTETRKFLINKEFGSLDVISKDFNIQHIKDNFYKAIGNLGKSVSDDFNINFDEFDSIENTSNLVKFFRSINVDLDVFLDAGFVYSIDLCKYWKRQFEDLVRDNKTLYASYLYNNAKKHDISPQNNFVRKLREFESFPDRQIPNTVFLDPMKILKDNFGDWTTHVPDGISVDEIYKENFALMNPANLYQDEIGNDEDAQAMIYFCAKDDFALWLENLTKKEHKSHIDFGTQVYERYKDILPEEVSLSYTDVSRLINGENIPGNSFHGVYSMKKSHQQERRLKEIGNSGELLIYNHLYSKYGNVEPKSEAFVQLGILAAGQAISAGYDMSYKDGDKTIYVEVKTGDGNRIYLSPGELAFAREHPDCYRVYYVTGLNRGKPKFSILPDRFWEDERFTMREIVESIEITF